MEFFKKHFPFSLITIVKICGLAIFCGGLTHLVLYFGYHSNYKHAHEIAAMVRQKTLMTGISAIIFLPFILTAFQSLQHRRFVPDVLLTVHRGFACLLGISAIITFEMTVPNVFIGHFINSKRDFPQFLIVCFLAGIILAVLIGYAVRKYADSQKMPIQQNKNQKTLGKKTTNTDYIVEPQRFTSFEEMQQALSPDSDLRIPKNWSKTK